jgi:hypothetical protein
VAVDHGSSQPAAPYALYLPRRLSAGKIPRSSEGRERRPCKYLILRINCWISIAAAVIPESRAAIALISRNLPDEVERLIIFT